MTDHKQCSVCGVADENVTRLNRAIDGDWHGESPCAEWYTHVGLMDCIAALRAKVQELEVKVGEGKDWAKRGQLLDAAEREVERLRGALVTNKAETRDLIRWQIEAKAVLAPPVVMEIERSVKSQATREEGK